MDYVGDKSQFYDTGLDEPDEVTYQCEDGHEWQVFGEYERQDDGYVAFVPYDLPQAEFCPECGKEGWRE